MSKVKAVAATIVLMVGASVAHGQGLGAGDQERNRDAAGVFNQTSYGQSELANRAAYLNAPTSLPPGTPRANRPMYVACWAEVPSHNTAYFSATFAASAVNSVRKEFREFVTTQYGPVSKLQCAGKFSETVVNEKVEKWKDSARSTKNAIVDT